MEIIDFGKQCEMKANIKVVCELFQKVGEDSSMSKFMYFM